MKSTKKLGIVLLLITILLVAAWYILIQILDILIKNIRPIDVVIAVTILAFVSGVIFVLDFMWVHAWVKGKQAYEVNGFLWKKRR